MIKEIVSIHIIKESRHYTLTDSRGASVEATSPEKLLDFLTIDYGNESCKIVFNIYQLLEILAQQLPKELNDKLNKEDRTWFGNYKIFSGGGKVLSIGHQINTHANFYDKVEVNIYGLKQYFPDERPANLNELNYLSGSLLHTLNELGWETETLSSAIAIFDDAKLSREYVPTVFDMPDNPEVDGLNGFFFPTANLFSFSNVYIFGRH